MPEHDRKLQGPMHGSPAASVHPLMLLAASTASQFAMEAVKLSKVSPAQTCEGSGPDPSVSLLPSTPSKSSRDVSPSKLSGHQDQEYTTTGLRC